MLITNEKLNTFLDLSLKTKNYKILPLAGDASSRKYYRTMAGDDSYVLMEWEPFDQKDYPFLSVLNHFHKNKVHVPEVVALSEEMGLVLLEDLGDLTLERKFWENQAGEITFSFYQLAIDELIKIHYQATSDKSDCTAFKIQFDVDKFMWEMNYAKEHLIHGVLKFKMDENTVAELNKSFLKICEELHAEPKFIAHRDYHSRNLMIKFDRMCVIDFQDARLGPVQYDLVSLLKDSYVDMNDQMAQRLIDDYLIKAKDYLPKDFSKEHFMYIYELQSLQRCFKACGSFASFFNARQDRRYLKYLTGTLRRVVKSLTLFPEHKILTDILIDSGALEKKYESL